jgi:hypothetical protein
MFRRLRDRLLMNDRLRRVLRADARRTERFISPASARLPWRPSALHFASTAFRW